MAGVDARAGQGLRRSAEHVRDRLQRRRRAHGLDRRPHRPLRGGLGQLPGDRLAVASSARPTAPSWYYNFEKLPWEDPTEHIRRSPLTYVGNVKTPTMLMTGVNDLRTPMPQTEQFYSALKLRKVPTAMMRFNDEWHGTTTQPVELHAHAAVPAILVRQVQARRRTATTTERNGRRPGLARRLDDTTICGFCDVVRDVAC